MSRALIQKLATPTFENMAVWQLSDGKTWMVTIRHGIKYHTTVTQGTDLPAVMLAAIEEERVPIVKAPTSIPAKPTRRKVPF